MNNSENKMRKLVSIENETGYPSYQNKPLGSLKWGHLALIEYFGDHFSSLAAYETHQLIEAQKIKTHVATEFIKSQNGRK